MSPAPPAAGVISLVVRLLAEPAADGRLVGQVEVVATGEVHAVHDEGELVALARRLGRSGRAPRPQPATAPSDVPT